MAEIRLGRWTDPESETEWQVESWTQYGSVRHHGENRLTRAGLPDDLDDLIEYWREGGSI